MDSRKRDRRRIIVHIIHTRLFSFSSTPLGSNSADENEIIVDAVAASEELDRRALPPSDRLQTILTKSHLLHKEAANAQMGSSR